MVDELESAVAKLGTEIASGPIVPRVTAQEIRDHLARYDFAEPLALNDVVADVEGMMRRWHVQVTHPRYFGLFNPSVGPASVIADTLVAMYNPQLATWRTSPAANEMERHTLRWLGSKFGFPENASANFTTGGAEANLSAALVALTQAFPECGEVGLRRLPATPTLYATEEAHHSFNKIAHMTGLGRQSVRRVGTDSGFRMDVEDLARRVAEDRANGYAPFMVVGTAGTTAAGAIDPLLDLARFCRSENLWFHVDGAWGGAAVIAPGLREHFAGIGEADSITCDAHKWFSVPMGAGMFFCRHPGAVAATFHAETCYMPGVTDGGCPDPYTSSIQWSRRFIGLKLFLSLAHQGESEYARMIEHQTQMGNELRRCLEGAGWRVVNATPLPLVCFTRDGLDTGSFLKRLHERQLAWMSEVRLNGGPAVLRACITSYKTTEADIQWVVREMSQLT